jgi:hypothetical protein
MRRLSDDPIVRAYRQAWLGHKNPLYAGACRADLDLIAEFEAEGLDVPDALDWDMVLPYRADAIAQIRGEDLAELGRFMRDRARVASVVWPSFERPPLEEAS